MKWRALRNGGVSCLVVMSCLCVAGTTFGAALDTKGEITLGLRTYASVRIQTEDTDIDLRRDANDQYFRALTFPVSSAGHIRQSRYFAEVQLTHDIDRLVNEGFGPFGLLQHLPFKVRDMKYTLIYRGEYEGTFDYGPSEFRQARQIFHTETVGGREEFDYVPCFSGQCVQFPESLNEFNAGYFRHKLRDTLSTRNRLFQAFLDFQAGDLFVRFGRQILVWGETDAFRLLDNINPVDNGFGGFLLPLDERRVPLDMLRLNYYFGDFGTLPNFVSWLPQKLGIYEAYLELYAAVDNQVGWWPGINVKGSAWALPNLGEPSATQFDDIKTPGRTIENTRGGGQFKFNIEAPGIGETTIGFAHYYTVFDTPLVRSSVSQRFPQAIQAPDQDYNGFLALVTQNNLRTQVTGATGTFAVPSAWARQLGLSGEPIIRTELAYFKREPRHTQGSLDPFIYGFGCGGINEPNARGGFTDAGTGLCSGGTKPGDSWNFVLGIDTNQFVRWLNARNSFFITTQFFYKHLNGAEKRRLASDLYNRDNLEGGIPINPNLPNMPAIMEGEVLPVPADRQRNFLAGLGDAGASQPNLVHNPTDQFLQTLLISTSYMSGQIVPSLTMVYDWQGAFAAIPQVTFLRDPLRFTISYSYLTANSLKGGAGVSLLRDRDNLLLQIEYVI
jgi:hypothetical protein